VAQRTGSTIYYVELFPDSAAGNGRQPVLALMPVPGEVDIVVASELMEAGRAVQRGFVSADRTALIFSTHRVYSMSERTAMGDGRVDSSALLETCRTAARTAVYADFAELAEAKRSVVSAALFGGLAASGALPFDRAAFEEAIRRGGIGLESSLAAFAAGYTAQQRTAPAAKAAAPSVTLGPRLASLGARIAKEFPASAHDFLIAGVSRLADYQDEAYAARYLDRLAPVAAADPVRAEVLRETARYLALWMSYEDAIRVADFKIRRARFERVRQEARVEQAQLLHIKEFLHPGIQEIADIMPAALGRFLLNSGLAKSVVAKLAGDGKILETSSLSGYLQLYTISSFRVLRPRSLRFQHEQVRIDAWIREIPALVKEDYALALRVAESPRLLKGYGDTYALGSRNFDAIVGALPRLRGRADAAEQLRTLCEAALADEQGHKLTETLKEVMA
jgi:indolepyruvate ferredoxin oxidoreductase beta subunit